MLEARLSWLRERGNAGLIRRGLRGIEKESLRVAASGRLSRAPHPRSLGSALTHPYLTTDYSEALLELVTPVRASNWELLQFLCDLHGFVHRRLADELLWPASMPCIVDADREIPIAYYGPSNVGRMKTVYRRGLGHRYGRAMQAIAGVHFNYSLPGAFWPAYAEREGSSAPPERFRSEQYMGLVRNYRRHAWLVMYLFGASPTVCKSFRPEGAELLRELDAATWHAPYATTLRMSDLGYRNKTQARLNISANSLDEYVAGLVAAVTTTDPRYEAIGVLVDGEYRQLNASILQIENEYYSSIRPKPRKGSPHRPTVALRTEGVEYVEVRTLDLNVVDPVGINQAQLRFLESLLVYCLLADSPHIGASEQDAINARELIVAREGRRPGIELPEGGGSKPLRDLGMGIVEGAAAVAELLEPGGEGYLAAVEAQREALAHPEVTPSARMLADLHGTGASFFEYALGVARDHHAYFRDLRLEPGRESALAEAARVSLDVAAAMESSDEVSFDAYLQQYFDAV